MEHLILNLSHYVLLPWIAIKLSEYAIDIKLDKDALAIEQNNYFTKIVNVYIIYDLDTY